jgi:probable phosphoglycerate mutase
MSDSLLLYLIRHGETPWSLSGQHTSRSEVALTANGERQARELGTRLRTVHFDWVFSSPRLRAQRTCALANLGTPEEVDHDLSEWDYGDYEGLRTADILRLDSNWNLWANGCPNGESPEEVSNRCDRLLERLRGLSGNIALFSHGHISCALAIRWIRLPIIHGQHLLLDPATLSILGCPDRHPETPAIRRWNA